MVLNKEEKKKKIEPVHVKDLIMVYSLIDQTALARFFAEENPDFVKKNLAAKLKAFKKIAKELEQVSIPKKEHK